MDNLSHSVVGLAVGELVHRSLAPEPDGGRQRLRRRLLLLSCWAASNFPDLDFFLTPLFPAPLGYLLHHRGHTHTLLYAIPQAILLSAMIWLLWPSARKLLQESASARSGMMLSLTLGFTLHLLMDYLNWYGVHPFHPFDSRWLYGDMVFIVEPLFWIAFGVPMAMMVRQPAFRYLLLALLIGAPLFFTIKGFLPWSSLAVLALIAVVLGALQHRTGVRGRSALLAALAVGIGFVGMQGYASGQARLAVVESLQENDPASLLLDASMSSFPTNPLCWFFVSVERNELAGSYRLRRGIVSLAPEILPVTACPVSLSDRPSQKVLTPAIAFLAQQHGSLDTLRKLRSENCHFAAWLRFARAPWLHDAEATDIRFGLDSGRNFTTINFADFKNRQCLRLVPGWDFPRSDLLTPPASPVAR
ncbi:MAG: metal-dependent hydrolase [Oxalobacteraceae bacterium]|nr:metal-dependent hydrolase [Oxalobacteraceae bacterium]